VQDSGDYQWIKVGTWEKDKPHRLNLTYSLLEFPVLGEKHDIAGNVPNHDKRCVYSDVIF